MGDRQELLRGIPKVDEMLQDERLLFFVGSAPRTMVVDALREVTDQVRKEILEGKRASALSKEEVFEQVQFLVMQKQKRSLRRVVNATGVTLHTNLGRAGLSRKSCETVAEAAFSYTNLEYDVKKGTRGSRHDHVEQLIRKITGAEAAMVVNNNAAATMLCLSALARGKEVVVSRGELVEIGGSFRIPDIMEESGAHLIEVGTTNKTKPSDYEKAYHEGATGAFLKVHTSNYRIVGFTQEVTVKELCEIKKECQVPVIYDMGSGLMVDLERFGIDEPTVTDALRDGADVVLFSGDKLLGGPQGGIIIGKKEYVDRMKSHPLARAFRVDKMTLAAMEATFFEYLDTENALKEIPTLRMITMEQEELRDKAERLKRRLTDAVQGTAQDKMQETVQDTTQNTMPDIVFTVEACEDQVGGGSAPTAILAGYAVTVSGDTFKAERAERMLRKAEIPVITRVAHDKLWLSVRTIGEDEFEWVVKAFGRIGNSE